MATGSKTDQEEALRKLGIEHYPVGASPSFLNPAAPDKKRPLEIFWIRTRLTWMVVLFALVYLGLGALWITHKPSIRAKAAIPAYTVIQDPQVEQRSLRFLPTPDKKSVVNKMTLIPLRPGQVIYDRYLVSVPVCLNGCAILTLPYADSNLEQLHPGDLLTVTGTDGSSPSAASVPVTLIERHASDILVAIPVAQAPTVTFYLTAPRHLTITRQLPPVPTAVH